MSMAFFSIVVPVYNTEQFVRECLDSVRAQTFPEWECICVDDGSTDGSPAILDEYAAFDRRFRVLHQKNSGVGAARNAAMNVARGEWLIFLDSDDMLHPEMLARCRAASKTACGCDIVRFGCLRWPDGEKLEWPTDEKQSRFRLTEISRRIPAEVFDGEFWTRAYKRGTAGMMYFSDLVVGEDWVWLASVLDVSTCIVDIDFPLYGYRKRLGSAMNSSPGEKKLVAHVKWRVGVAEIFDRSEKSIDDGLARRTVLNCTERLSSIFFTVSDMGLRKKVWGEWLVALRKIGRMKIASWWSKFAANTVYYTKSSILAWLFFKVPFSLKVLGLHR